jgi:hypothetical protein
MGATDVVPFVPVKGVTLEDCVALARQLGERVGRELGIPVYLYEEAATRPDRCNLADVRRGEYEGLQEEIATNPDRSPDFGPAMMGTAGATAIGARPPLIAFNVYLNTDDCQSRSAFYRGPAVCESTGSPCGGTGADLYEPDRLPPHTHPPRTGVGPHRGNPLRPHRNPYRSGGSAPSRRPV